MSTDRVQQILRSRKAILDQTTDSIVNTPGFIKLLAILGVYRSSFPGGVFTLLMDESVLPNLDFSIIKINLASNISPVLRTKNMVQVNEKFEVINAEVYNPNADNDARRKYQEMSMQGQVIIVATRFGITYFSHGIELNAQGGSKWLTETDMKRFKEKKDISEVLDVLEDYKTHLRHLHVYEKFFASKTTLNRIGYLPKKKNLLKNSPEKIFQDDLKAFLSDNIVGTFHLSKEEQLVSKKRLDVNITDSVGNYYFFEIKWLGISIDANDFKPNTEFKISDMKQGVNQTLEYIQELIEDEKKTVKLGYLLIFDAREEKVDFDLKPFDYLKKDSLKEFLPMFEEIKDFKVDNIHPR